MQTERSLSNEVAMESKKPAAKKKKSSDDSKSTSSPGSENAPVKKKRKSPAVPWKKPKDMPKRPLSAYNLYFRDQRELLISAGPHASSSLSEVGTEIESTRGQPGAKGGRKRSKKSSKATGVGFANLAKTIAASWNELDAGTKAPYEERAAVDKKRYDEAVAIWREKQKALKESVKKQKKEAGKLKDPPPAAYPTQQPAPAGAAQAGDRSIGSFSDHDTYPSEWFETAERHVLYAAGSAGVPPFVDTQPVTAEETFHPGATFDTPQRLPVPQQYAPAQQRRYSYEERIQQPPQAATATFSALQRSFFSHSPQQPDVYSVDAHLMASQGMREAMAAPYAQLRSSHHALRLDESPIALHNPMQHTPSPPDETKSSSAPSSGEQQQQPEIGYVRSVEEMASDDFAPLDASPNTLSLRNLNESLDEDSLDFLNNLRFS